MIKDLLGEGKTTLAHGLAHTLGLQLGCIPFTSDRLPADILGISVYERNRSQFKFHLEPTFKLADRSISSRSVRAD
ncbi:MAG: AAA family ATPase [Gallionella sp.]